MTVRKERRARGGVYWMAYWRVGGRLRKVYLGPASAVTGPRLRAIATTWLVQALTVAAFPAPRAPVIVMLADHAPRGRVLTARGSRQGVPVLSFEGIFCRVYAT